MGRVGCASECVATRCVARQVGQEKITSRFYIEAARKQKISASSFSFARFVWLPMKFHANKTNYVPHCFCVADFVSECFEGERNQTQFHRHSCGRPRLQ